MNTGIGGEPVPEGGKFRGDCRCLAGVQGGGVGISLDPAPGTSLYTGNRMGAAVAPEPDRLLAIQPRGLQNVSPVIIGVDGDHPFRSRIALDSK